MVNMKGKPRDCGAFGVLLWVGIAVSGVKSLGIAGY